MKKTERGRKGDVGKRKDNEKTVWRKAKRVHN